MKTIRRTIAVSLMIAVAITFMPVINGQICAASKKPAAPKITSVQEGLSAYDDGPAVDIRWKKAKNAKKYQVAILSTTKKWVKVTTVKKSAKNKKKYTKKGKYKVVAKGNKYKVYQYKYRYSILDCVKGSSYRIANDVEYHYGKYDTAVELRANTTYTFAVRSVNGNKYSSWSRIAFKISNDGYHGSILTTPGQSLATTVNGKATTLTVGKECAVPVPGPRNANIAIDSVTIVPGEIKYESAINKGIKMEEEIIVNGKTQNGLDAYWRILITKGVCESVYYTIEDPTFNKDGSKYSIKKWFTSSGGPSNYMAKDITVNDPNVKVVWALDGTAPVLGQADRSIKGNEYPFGQPPSTYKPYTGNLKVRGSVSHGSSDRIWNEIRLHQGNFNYVEWIKVYNGNAPVGEFFEGAYYFD